MSVDTDAAKSRLEVMQAELRSRLDHLGLALAEPLDPDSSERAVEMEDDQPLEGQALLVTRELGSVDRALERIVKGEYGICVKCGAEISSQRLDARPEAALCIDCAENAG